MSTLKFCQQCESVMTKSTSATGIIVFQCRCQLTEEGQPDDTLMAEEFLETAESNQKHEVFIENSPYDPAGNIVMKDCPQCGLNFLTMIRIGSAEVTIYTCSCGYRATHSEYMKAISSAKAQSVKPEKPAEKK